MIILQSTSSGPIGPLDTSTTGTTSIVRDLHQTPPLDAVTSLLSSSLWPTTWAPVQNLASQFEIAAPESKASEACGADEPLVLSGRDIDAVVESLDAVLDLAVDDNDFTPLLAEKEITM